MIVSFFTTTLNLQNIANFITLDVFYYTIINQLSLLADYNISKNSQLVFFLYNLLLQTNSVIFEHILNDIMYKAFYCSYSEVESI